MIPSAPSPDEVANRDDESARAGFWEKLAYFFVDRRVIVFALAAILVVAGLIVAPFGWDVPGVPSDPVAVDAIPDIGENQQIVFTRWAGRSPRDVEDQVSYPLTTALLGIPGVRTVRSFSMFGFSTVYVIFEDGVDFYWSRSRVLEKLASLPSDLLPNDVSPALGPDATALGQVFWYSLEGRDPKSGEVLGGFSQEELRSIQDWTIRYALQSAEGVSEVASVGGYVKEYQIDVDPTSLRAHHVGIDTVAAAVKKSNLDVGARTMEINRAEYVIRGIGFVKSVRDLEETVVANVDHKPVRIRDLARVGLGPAQRRGALDKNGAPAVGGVVVARYGTNPLAAIDATKQKIEEIASSLPKKTLEDGRISQVTIVPFYDRTQLIHETIGTLSTALWEEILVTIIVVLVIMRHLRTSMLISSLVPLGVLGALLMMKVMHVDANIMALSGIAIAIGTMVDLGIVFTENTVKHLDSAAEGASTSRIVARAAGEVAPAVATSTLTTIIGFIPVFGLTAAEGKLFRPLAYTKSFAMICALGVALFLLPPVASIVLSKKKAVGASGNAKANLSTIWRTPGPWIDALIGFAGAVVCFAASWSLGLTIIAIGGLRFAERVSPAPIARALAPIAIAIVLVLVVCTLADHWMPLGAARGTWLNRFVVAGWIGALLGAFWVLLWVYPWLLGFFLRRRGWILGVAIGCIAFALLAWRGFDHLTKSWLPAPIADSRAAMTMRQTFPGFGREFMPPFDEGSYLYMPTTMPHASMGQALEQMEAIDRAIKSVPEVENATGKLGRVDSALDPAPISMFEVIVTYKTEYKTDAHGRRLRFRYDHAEGAFARDENGELILDDGGKPFRQWRDGIQSAKDIWKAIEEAVHVPGITQAPELMPIAARIVMLQSGMRAPMGVKVHGPDLESVEAAALLIEKALGEVSSVKKGSAVADRIVGKPYLEIEIDRDAIARHGLSIESVQNVIQIAVGGMTLSRTVEGRERYPIRVRFPREERGDIESLERVLVPTPLGHQIPLGQVAKIRHVRGPQVIKSEDTFLTGYVTFDKAGTKSEVEVVDDARNHLDELIATGKMQLPEGTSFTFAGSYENQVRSEKRLALLFPVALVLVFILIYAQFKRLLTTLMVFSSVFVAVSGGMILIYLYNQPWFLNVSPLGIDLRDLMQVRPTAMSVGVWVGFIALVGIATDDAVIMATYLEQRFRAEPPTSIADVRERTIEAGTRRVRPCLMTTATTILALLPVITSTGRGSDVMVPMALPVLGGMSLQLFTLWIVPVLYAWREEGRVRRAERRRLREPTVRETPATGVFQG